MELADGWCWQMQRYPLRTVVLRVVPGPAAPRHWDSARNTDSQGPSQLH